MSGRFPFNVRVYGLLIENDRVLVSDEMVKGLRITKFPGGGLEFGEGPAECIVREWKEELGQRIEVLSHFYTTEFFQRSAFRKDDQVISIYYLVQGSNPPQVTIHSRPGPFVEEGGESFRWLHLPSARLQDLTLPIDRKVLELLKGF